MSPRLRRAPQSEDAGAPPAATPWPLSDGEIHYVWWFIQGSIMEPAVRTRLRRAWGFCDRHAWGALAVETAFRHRYLHGPAVLYQDLMERAARAFRPLGPGQSWRLARSLRATGPCPMCDLDLEKAGRGAARPDLFEIGRDAEPLQAFAAATRAYWWPSVCGRCLEDGSPSRCRPHLQEDTRTHQLTGLQVQRALVEYVTAHVSRYSRSFRWECRGTDTDEDRAALISAVGWCSGWRAWLPLLR